jgi:hypothetical protein
MRVVAVAGVVVVLLLASDAPAQDARMVPVTIAMLYPDSGTRQLMTRPPMTRITSPVT